MAAGDAGGASGRSEGSPEGKGLGSGRPVREGIPLGDIGGLPGGGVLAQLGNSCGTCCLSAILGHFGVTRSPAEIDREIRNGNIFTAPDLIARYARRAGLNSVIRNRGSLEEVEGLIGRGIPVVLVVISKPGTRFRPPVLHYVTVIDCRCDGQGYRVGIYNPWGLREELSGGELSRIWDDIRAGPLKCWRSAYIALAPPGTDLGPSRRAGSRGLDTLGLAIAGAVNGAFHVLRDGRLFEGVAEVACSLPLAVTGLAFLAVEQSARAGAEPGAG